MTHNGSLPDSLKNENASSSIVCVRASVSLSCFWKTCTDTKGYWQEHGPTRSGESRSTPPEFRNDIQRRGAVSDRIISFALWDRKRRGPPCLIPVVGMPPDFLNVEGDAAAEVDRCVFFAHAKALVVLEGLK